MQEPTPINQDRDPSNTPASIAGLWFLLGAAQLLLVWPLISAPLAMGALIGDGHSIFVLHPVEQMVLRTITVATTFAAASCLWMSRWGDFRGNREGAVTLASIAGVVLLGMLHLFDVPASYLPWRTTSLDQIATVRPVRYSLFSEDPTRLPNLFIGWTPNQGATAYYTSGEGWRNPPYIGIELTVIASFSLREDSLIGELHNSSSSRFAPSLDGRPSQAKNQISGQFSPDFLQDVARILRATNRESSAWIGIP